MSKLQDEFYEYIFHDVLGSFPNITSRKMFGGYGFYQDGIFFALIANNQLYFKVNESNKADYIAYNSQPFTYHKNRKEIIMSYWVVPESILENKEQLAKWIEKSVKINSTLPSIYSKY